MSFSREFKFTAPKDDFSPQDLDNLWKTTFVKARVEEFLDSNLSADRIVVRVAMHPVFHKDCYAIEAYIGPNRLGSLLGDLPCPDQCIPPFIDANNTFEISHIRSAINYRYCAYLNIRNSQLNTSLTPSLSIYGVAVLKGAYVEKKLSGDNIFISLQLTI